jgi:hypothetical protein
MNRYFFLALVALIALASCKRRVRCEDAPLFVRFPTPDYDSTQIGDVVFSSYTKDGTFSELIYTEHKSLSIRVNGYVSQYLSDSTNKYPYAYPYHFLSDNTFLLQADVDWVIAFPLVGKTFYISNIQHYNKKKTDGGLLSEIDPCVSDIRFTLNGKECEVQSYRDEPKPFDLK